MFENDDMILPEGFDPQMGDQNFTEEGELVDVVAPTTDATTANSNVTEETQAQASAQDATTSPDAQAPTLETPSVPEAPVVPQTLKVRYNHEDRELPLDQAAILAQKGLNFDKLEQKSKDNEAKLNHFEEMAKLFGFDNAESMMTQAEQNYVETKIKDLVDQGNTEAMARFLVNQEMQGLKKNMAPAPAPEQKSVPGLKPEIKAELDEFIAAYPGVTKIPDEVFAMHKEGVQLKAAYAIYEKQKELKEANDKYKSAQDELAILRQNQAAAARGPVTGTIGKSTQANEQAEDPFVKGFNFDL